uniref:Sodium-dependent lysophosphatidylcholine symporter 1-B-like n=1 Tax=Petromyzon marinus TaxID=7757 RepID=A0AAJ7TEY3_PETMA|nr:sodium-dependent lysophosphatidylcholine symporter 1-B-like [Petromyzon marinus]
MAKGEGKGADSSNSGSESSLPESNLLNQESCKEPKSTKLSVMSKICFGIGGAPYQMTGSAIGFFFQIFLLDVAQLKPFYASVILFAGRAWDALTDPAVGYFVSRSRRTRYGTLLPWIAVSTPLGVITYFLLWVVPPGDIQMELKVLWYLLWYCLFQTLLTCFHVPYSALTMFLSDSQKERDSVTGYRMTVEVLGTVMGAAIQGQISQAFASGKSRVKCEGLANSSSLYSPNATSAPNATDLWVTPGVAASSDDEHLEMLRMGYMVGAAVIAGLYLLCAVTVFFGVKERDDGNCSQTEKVVPFATGVRLVLQHGPYMKLIFAFLFTSLGFLLVEGNFALFCVYTAGFENDLQHIVLTILGTAALSIPLWQWFMGMFGKKAAVYVGMLWIFPFLCILYFISDNLAVAYIVAAASGISVAAAYLLPWSMLPDVVDDFRLKYPDMKGIEAIFYSFYVFFIKFASGVSLGVSTLSLEFAGYVTNACEQPPTVSMTLKLLVVPIPILLIVLGLLIFRTYPIDEARRKRTSEELLKQRAEKAPLELTEERQSNV